MGLQPANNDTTVKQTCATKLLAPSCQALVCLFDLLLEGSTAAAAQEGLDTARWFFRPPCCPLLAAHRLLPVPLNNSAFLPPSHGSACESLLHTAIVCDCDRQQFGDTPVIEAVHMKCCSVETPCCHQYCMVTQVTRRQNVGLSCLS